MVALRCAPRGSHRGAACRPARWRKRSESDLRELAVADAHRRRGVATALLRRLESLGTARGVHGILREDVAHVGIPIGEV